MATRQPLLLLLDHSQWSLARLSPTGVETTTPVRWEGTALESETERILSTLKEWNATKQPLLLGLGASLCISMLLKLPTSRHARQRQAMGYLLEPYLPWAAEDMVADYEIRGREAFAVGTSTELLSSLLKRLEEEGVRAQSIAPLGRLALQHYLRRASASSPRRGVLWGAGTNADLWIIEGKHPLLWRQIPLEERDLLLELKQLALEENAPLPLELIHIPEELQARIATLSDFVVSAAASESTATILESALRESTNILNGRADPPLEFRREGLAPESGDRALRGAWQFVQAAILCLLIASGVTLYRQGEKSNQLRLQASDRQREIFQQLFPDLPTPVGVRSRLESEYARLRGMSGEQLDTPEQIPATRLVERLLRSLPVEMRFRLLEIRIEQGRLYLVGQVRAHADADRIADELRKVKLTVDPPSTHRLPQQGVEFRISAQLPTEVPAKGAEKI